MARRTTKSESSESPDVFMSKYDQISEQKFSELQRRIEVIESVLRSNPKINFDKLAAKVSKTALVGMVLRPLKFLSSLKTVWWSQQIPLPCG